MGVSVTDDLETTRRNSRFSCAEVETHPTGVALFDEENSSYLQKDSWNLCTYSYRFGY